MRSSDQAFRLEISQYALEDLSRQAEEEALPASLVLVLALHLVGVGRRALPNSDVDEDSGKRDR